MSPSRASPRSRRATVTSAYPVPGYGIVAALLLVSGAVALMYEVIWQRQFALLFGSSGPATALVLAAYFGGLGLGSLAAQRWSARLVRPLRAYGVLEALIAAGALLVPVMLAGTEVVYPWLYSIWSDTPAAFAMLRGGLACAALSIPTMAMGATLPVLGQWVDRHGRQLGISAGGLYVANTTGAAFGALAVPFVTLPWLGLHGSMIACVVTNLLVAAGAIVIDRRLEKSGVPRSAAGRADAVSSSMPTRTAVSTQAPAPAPPVDRFPAATFAAISGGATFALQVLWNRAFAQVHENSMYSFAVIVAIVILALAVGGQAARTLLRRGVSARSIVGVGWLAGGIAVLVMPALFLHWTDGLDYLVSDRGWAESVSRLVGLAVLLVFVPMALLGAALPAVMHRAGRGNASISSGRVLGRLLAANVVGAVTGALVAGFVLPDVLGLWTSLGGIGGALVATGIWVNIIGRGTPARWFLAAGLAAGACGIGMVFVQLDLPRVHLDVDDRLVALDEGAHGIVAVVERPGSRRLKLNNHYALGGSAATGDERMAVHLPLLLHPAPKRVALLGLGTGISAGAATFHPVEHMTAIELVPEVVAAARNYFAVENRRILESVRTRVVTDDARHHLRASGERYDVIVGDLVIPWQEGEGNLLTLEQFEAARTALAPGGIYCQWLPLFQLSEEEFEIVVRTFLTVFPKTELWRGDFSPTEPALALIGGEADWPSVAERVSERLSAMERDPANPHLSVPEAVWMHWVGPLSATLLRDDPRLNTQGRPWVQLLAPFHHASSGNAGGFTGRPLEAWLDRVRFQPAPVTNLTSHAPRARQAGRHLADVLLCLAERDMAGARAARDRLHASLPAEVAHLLVP